MLGGIALLIGVGFGIYSLVFFAGPSLTSTFKSQTTPVKPNVIAPTVPSISAPYMDTKTGLTLSQEVLDELRAIHPEQADAERLQEIREAFAVDQRVLNEQDLARHQEMHDIIMTLFEKRPDGGTTFRLDRFYRPEVDRRIESLMTPAAVRKSDRNFNLRFAFSYLLPVQVCFVRSFENDIRRVVYCRMGDVQDIPFRFWLIRQGEKWQVYDFENIGQGLSMCELVAIKESVRAISPWLFGIFANTLDNGYQPPSIWDNAKPNLTEVPRVLLDNYLLSVYNAGYNNRQPQSDLNVWLQRIESPDRVIEAHSVRAKLALLNNDHEKALEHTQAYIDRMEFASINPYVIRGELYATRNRYEESAENWRIALTWGSIPPSIKATLLARCLTPEWKPFLGPVAMEYGIVPKVPSVMQQSELFATPVSKSYADFRATFRTSLRRKAPSPQKSDPIQLRPGASWMPYQSGELQLQAILQFPESNEERVPAVVFLHGGFAYGDEDWDMVVPFLRNGFAGMTPILRGENSQPGSFSLYYDEVNDVLAATVELAKNPRIDSNRIFIAGHSAGGTLSILSSMASNRFRGAASFSGMMDCRYQSSLDLCAFKTSVPNEWIARSPRMFARSLQCPTRLYHGVDEELFIRQTEDTARQARAAGRDVDYQVVEGDHMSSVPPATEKAIEFFKSLH